MRIAAISDLHIGPQASRDAFGHPVDRFVSFLEHLEAWADRIVLLGDIWQCDHTLSPTPHAHRRALAAATARTTWLTERLRDPRYVLIAGNHDAVAEEILGALPFCLLGDGKARALFIHGHQFDPLIGHAPRTSAAATWMSGRLRATGLNRAATWLEQRDVAIKAKRFQGPQGPYADGARALMATHQVQTVVMGHTHVPMVRSLDGGVWANTGSCSLGRFSGIALDTDTGWVQQLSNGRPALPHPRLTAAR